MSNIALYLMNEKGLLVLNSFTQEFGAARIEYIVSSEDKNLRTDHYEEIKHLAKKFKIPFYNKSDIYDDIEQSFTGFKFAIGWRWLIKNTTNLIVFHDSLLPKYRGFAPLVNSLINHEKQCGVTALFATNDYDAGNIIEQISTDIEYPIKISDAIAKIAPLYSALVCNTYNRIINGEALPQKKQDNTDATYSMWLDDNDYIINWTWSSEKIKRFIDAVGNPYAGASSHIKSNVIKIWDSSLIEDVKIEHRERHLGKVIFFRKDHPVVVCNEGLLAIHSATDLSGDTITINLRTRFH